MCNSLTTSKIELKMAGCIQKVYLTDGILLCLYLTRQVLSETLVSASLATSFESLVYDIQCLVSSVYIKALESKFIWLIVVVNLLSELPISDKTLLLIE